MTDTFSFGTAPIEVYFYDDNTREAQEKALDAAAAAATAAAQAVIAAAQAALASDSADLAEVAALTLNNVYPDTASGLAAVAEGGYFWTSNPLKLWLDVAGVAIEQDAPATRAFLASSSGAAGVGFQQLGAGSILRDMLAKAREVISVTDFGADPAGLTNSGPAFAAARAYAALRSFAGNSCRIVFPPGRYSYETSPNWGVDRLCLDFQGEVWLAKYGTGPAFIIDGGSTTGINIIGLRITGFPMIYDDGANNHCIYARALGNCELELNARSAGTSFAGFYGEWLVDNDIKLICSGLEGGSPSFPAKGMHLTTRGANEDSSYNRIYARISGDAVTRLPIGIYLDAALGNEITGTIQNCILGYEDTLNAWENKLRAVDFEANTADAEIYGQQTQLLACELEVGPIFKSGAIDCKMVGGATQNVTVDSGAIDTLLSGFTYNRLRVGGTGAISDAGTRTRFRDLVDGTAGKVHNSPRTRLTPTVGASPYSYTNTSGNNQAVIVSGGTVTGITLSRLSGDAVGVTSGQFYLAPEDTIIVSYSAAPTVAVWPM